MSLILLSSNLHQQAKVFQEIALKSILSQNFKNTNHPVIPIVNHIVETRSI
jgi:hypothetical protein